MSEAYAPAGLRACLQVPAELRAAAVDASSDLPMRERRALATLASAVEAQAAHRWRPDRRDIGRGHGG